MKTVKTKIYIYKDFVGVDADTEHGKFINDISQPNQLGMVIDVAEIVAMPDAIEYIKNNYKREGGSFAAFMLTKHTEKGAERSGGSKASIGVMGKGKQLLALPEHPKVEIGRTCELEVLDMIPTDENMIAPADFVQAVDNMILAGV